MPRFLRFMRTATTAMTLTLASFVSLPDAALAQMGPDYWQVTGVASNDTLNIRSGPGTSNRVVARAPNGAVFRNLGCRGEGTARWCHLETPNGQISGWAAGRYLRESGAPTGGTIAGRPDVPELHARSSGEIEVRFASGCTALFNPIGRVITAGSSCSRAQRSAADQAVASYLRENSPGADHSGGASTTDVNVSGSGTIYGGASLNGRIFGHKEGAYALTVSGDGLTCTGLLRHAPGTVGSESTNVHCVGGAHGLAVLVRNRSGNGSTLTITLTNGTGGYVLF
ncbi:SH3 domain-containing protein [Salipiger abyssi]|uniref:SH3 domain-containing protein n=1 Tax=Salipiger abyssi TaxID=1250539 RepID=UPI001A8FE839|nr:SH3 domain-containing protein [Salipiger abyssi]MBN9888971.1 SH3 domain-containing protein [Salipiger abyssi]